MKPKSEYKSNSYNILSFLHEDYEKAQNNSPTASTKPELEKALSKLNSVKEEILNAIKDQTVNWGKFNHNAALQILFT
jgi:hypothetical protein